MTDDDFLAPIPRRKPILLPDYPGEDVTEPGSRWDDHGCCEHCGHDRLEHAEKSCGVWYIAGIRCGCPIGRDAK